MSGMYKTWGVGGMRKHVVSIFSSYILRENVYNVPFLLGKGKRPHVLWADSSEHCSWCAATSRGNNTA